LAFIFSITQNAQGQNGRALSILKFEACGLCAFNFIFFYSGCQIVHSKENGWKSRILKDWLRPCSKDKHSAGCHVCNKDFTIRLYGNNCPPQPWYW
jgi:hypothetical protein